MKKLIIPAIAIAVVGGYVYYQNADSGVSAAGAAGEVGTVLEKGGSGAAQESDTSLAAVDVDELAGADGDIFADAPEQSLEAVGDDAEKAAATEPGEEIDHANE
ncbi:hypothetical protein [Microbulbifer discodermiae]|uniref:hypothetical protein n=1 Tax=Microbulbifer sp. 2201CG32-9 TaxID=3232309 RepID=UPI00345B53DF